MTQMSWKALGYRTTTINMIAKFVYLLFLWTEYSFVLFVSMFMILTEYKIFI